MIFEFWAGSTDARSTVSRIGLTGTSYLMRNRTANSFRYSIYQPCGSAEITMEALRCIEPSKSAALPGPWFQLAAVLLPCICPKPGVLQDRGMMLAEIFPPANLGA